MPEIIDPVFVKTSQNARFLLSENERFGLVFVKTGSINSGTGLWPWHQAVFCHCMIFAIVTSIYFIKTQGTKHKIIKRKNGK